jgi:SAM-dependent methyltransferase
MATATRAIDAAEVDRLMGQVLLDLGGTLHAALVAIGEDTGLYKAMAGAGPLTPEEVAQRAGLHERYVREWLRAQAAGGYLAHHPEGDRYELTAAGGLALADDDGLSVPGAFKLVLALLRDAPKVAERFRTGEGLGWHEHDEGLFEGTERFFRPGYAANLTSAWIPALDGVEAKLLAGARVADVGCGHGASTILMAQAYPASTFIGFDYHEGSIARARQAAAAAGVADRVAFQVASSTGYPGSGYDLVAMFDCLHDMGDPAAAAAHVLRSLADDGTWLVVEPFAGDRVEDNMNPVGRLYYAASTLVCTPASLDQEGRAALGAQAGEARLTEVIRAGGFTRVRRAAETPVNLILEARP